MTLRFERSGVVREVAELRPDGWPICPCCNNDELAAIHAIPVTSPNEIDLCYVCGPVEVIEGVATKADAEPAPGDERQGSFDA